MPVVADHSDFFSALLSGLQSSSTNIPDPSTVHGEGPGGEGDAGHEDTNRLLDALFHHAGEGGGEGGGDGTDALFGLEFLAGVGADGATGDQADVSMGGAGPSGVGGNLSESAHDSNEGGAVPWANGLDASSVSTHESGPGPDAPPPPEEHPDEEDDDDDDDDDMEMVVIP